MIEYINENIKLFKEKFENTKLLGWVKSLRTGSTGIGYTFEKLIGKDEENFEIPDYNGIEIKTKRNLSSKFITMFNANPDGTYLFEIERILQKYGYPDNILTDSKVFQISIYSNIKISTCKYKFQLNVNRFEKKIHLLVYDKKDNLIDDEAYWSFDLLQEKLNRKLKLLAVITANTKYTNQTEYFKYEALKIYELKNFDSFLNAVELGYIRVTFKIGVFRTGKRRGQIHNHGIGFDICRHNILYI